MTKPTLPFLALGVALAFLWACDGHYRHHHDCCSTVIGSGDLATESRPVQGFTAVAVSGASHLIVEQTGVESLEITAEDNVLPLVQSEVQSGRLVLGVRPDAGVTLTREVLFRLTVRDLTEVEASGASRVEIRGVDTPDLTMRVSGACDVSAAGFAERVQLDLTGASRFEAPDLRSRVMTANLVGASYALVRASESLEVNATGASVVEYLGDPILTANVAGGSIVRRAGP